MLPHILFQANLLEIGAGAGWQALALEKHGARVTAIDVQHSNYESKRVFPVEIYNGVSIPFTSESFDVVFSSNTLEHVYEPEKLLLEIKRVLRPGGVAIHIVPSAGWRFWTNLAHFPYLFKRMCKSLSSSSCVSSLGNFISLENTSESKLSLIPRFNVLYPKRHGEVGNCITEIFLFSRTNWKRLFVKQGFKIKKVYGCHLFYTGYQLMGHKISTEYRRMLSYILGSASHVFVMKK